MKLTKYKLGELIEQCDSRNADKKYTVNDVKGISTGKEFIETKANMDGVSLASYKIVKKDEFAYVADTSRRGDKIAVAFNSNGKEILISSIYIVFRVSKTELLLSDYLFMYFNRPEFDRYSRFNSWGSARETFSWEDMCDIEIDLPPLPIQKKYVDIYNAMIENQKSYERGLEDLKLVCDVYIEDLRRKMPCEAIGSYILEKTDRVSESENAYKAEDVMGISSIEKSFMITRADTSGLSLSSYKIVKPNDFSFNPNTARMGDKIPIALNKSEADYLVSAIYPVFSVDKTKLLPDYLMVWFTRAEFDRYARFNSWGSARETFDFPDMKEVEIPIPDIDVQRSIANIYKVYNERKKINEQLKAQIKDICPVLIKGSLEEGRKTKEA